MYLERLIRSVVRSARGGSVAHSEVEVQLTDETVACKPKSDSGYVIHVSATADDQYVTDLPKECWGLLRQEVELYHELSHVLYTDWEQFETPLKDVENEWKYAFDRVKTPPKTGRSSDS